ncbi:MAG: hypothetical protein WAK18_14140 [Nocardioidaceae bacterium]
MRSRVVLAAVISVVAAAGVSAAVVMRSDSASSHGPIAPQPNHGSIVDITRVGAVKADGHETLRLSGDSPATITNVEVIGGEESMKFLGAMVAGPGRKFGAKQLFHRYPPPPHTNGLGSVEPAIGAVLQPTTGPDSYELLIGFRYIADTFAARSTVIVSYTVDGKRYRADLHARWVTCPTTMTNDECSARTDKLFPDG